MKSFLIKSIVFFLIVGLSFFLILSMADGYTDPFYTRFTSTKQKNLILGTSRSAQGLQPSIFNKLLNKSFFNYSFTIAHSPYGPKYLSSIKRKLDSNTKNGIFILSVDPWSISSITANPNDTLNFRENELCVGNTNSVNVNPNFEYLLKNLKGKYYTVLTIRKGSMYLHNDGWLDVNVPMDSITVINRINKNIEEYRTKNLPIYKFSPIRLLYLKKIISFLKNHGKVYLVRLPVYPETFKIDNELISDFNQKINSISSVADGYLDMTNENSLHQYTDGSHLYKESGKLVSEKIAFWIKNNL